MTLRASEVAREHVCTMSRRANVEARSWHGVHARPSVPIGCSVVVWTDCDRAHEALGLAATTGVVREPANGAIPAVQVYRQELALTGGIGKRTHLPPQLVPLSDQHDLCEALTPPRAPELLAHGDHVKGADTYDEHDAGHVDAQS